MYRYVYEPSTTAYTIWARKLKFKPESLDIIISRHMLYWKKKRKQAQHQTAAETAPNKTFYTLDVSFFTASQL